MLYSESHDEPLLSFIGNEDGSYLLAFYEGEGVRIRPTIIENVIDKMNVQIISQKGCKPY